MNCALTSSFHRRNDMKRKIKKIVKTCDSCQINKPLTYNNKGWTTTSHKPQQILEQLSMDLMGPLPTSCGGTHYILAILDTFSKYIKLYALKKATTTAILNKLENEYIPEIGKPHAILTDNGIEKMEKKTTRNKYNNLLCNDIPPVIKPSRKIQ